jgi:hypothetical protein
MEFQIQKNGDNWNLNSIIIIAQFSHLLQKSLLSKGFTNPFQSFGARQNLADRRLRTRILGEPIGTIEAASTEPKALVPRSPIYEEYIYSSFGSNAGSWERSMRFLSLDAWGRFPIMECESVLSPRVFRLTTFTAKCLGGKWAVGISREGIEAGDILRRKKGGMGDKADSFAVLRAYPDNKVILARASLAKELQELKANGGTIQRLPSTMPLGCDP